MPDRRSPLAPFRNDTFRLIWVASLASNFGGLIQAVGAAWMMASISTSANMVALVQASTALPIMLFSVASGALADNFDRRRIMLTAQCFMLVVSATLTLLAWYDLLTPWLLLTFTFLIGCGTALNNPAWQASVGDMVPREDFARAVTAGLCYVTMSPNILRVMFRGFAFGLAASAILSLLPLVARDLVAGGPFTYGILLGCFGFGAIGGALLSARLRERFTGETIVRMAFAGFALSAAITATSTLSIVTGGALLIAGACWVLALSLFNTTVQLSTPRWVVGRALSLYQTTTFGGMAGGSWVWGTLADTHGAPTSLYVSAGVMVLGAAIGLRYALPQFEALDLAPLNRFSEPNLPLDLKPRSGPIVVLIDYEIDEADIPAFLTAMTERRRIRIRDGAGQWALMRDLENPTLWTETYHVPTWVEYVRHNQRRTQADAENGERLRRLHRGSEGPRVHRMIERQTILPHDYERYKQQMDMH